MKVYLYQIGVIQNDGDQITQVKQRYEATGTPEIIREDAMALLDNLDSGIVLIKDGDDITQIGDYDGDVDLFIQEIDEKIENHKDII